jgi:hypothetical protein
MKYEKSSPWSQRLAIGLFREVSWFSSYFHNKFLSLNAELKYAVFVVSETGSRNVIILALLFSIVGFCTPCSQSFHTEAEERN